MLVFDSWAGRIQMKFLSQFSRSSFCVIGILEKFRLETESVNDFKAFLQQFLLSANILELCIIYPGHVMYFDSFNSIFGGSRNGTTLHLAPHILYGEKSCCQHFQKFGSISVRNLL